MIGTTLASIGGGAGWFGLGAGASGAPAPGPAALRAGVLGGVEEEVLRFVATSSPALSLDVAVFPTARAIRAALRASELAVGSFETALDLANLAENPDAALASAGLSITLPLGLYSKALRSLSELVYGSRVLLPEEPAQQGRALLVLYHYGLIGFDEQLGPRARLGDVTANARGLELVPSSDDVRFQRARSHDLVALDYRSATALGLAPARNALAMEDGFSPFAQVVTVRDEDRRRRPAWLERFLAAYRAPAVKQFILRRFEDSVRRAW